MRINNNIMAMNAYRQLGITNNSAAKAMERLSSGYRINRAGDDAAGLAISEKMRGQIRGLNMASKNAQDGISLIQTAEGALQETHAILQRMRELAVQAANDTNVVIDRGELQKEVDQLSQEISRIAETTQFNTQYLLNGTFTGVFHIGANKGQDITLSIDNMSAASLNVARAEITATAATIGDYAIVTNNTEENITIKFAEALSPGSHSGVTETTAVFDEESNTITITLEQADGDSGGDITATKADVIDALKEISEIISVEAIEGIALEEAAAVEASAITVEAATTTIEGIDISSQEAASSAIEVIQNAIETVSAERSKLGAMQNRLEHTIKNLDTSSENLQAAESRIRDVDMAKEMMEFTKFNILQQAATAMLAQANMLPSGVLQLLQ